jgi:hypothetical protein
MDAIAQRPKILVAQISFELAISGGKNSTEKTIKHPGNAVDEHVCGIAARDQEESGAKTGFLVRNGDLAVRYVQEACPVARIARAIRSDYAELVVDPCSAVDDGRGTVAFGWNGSGISFSLGGGRIDLDMQSGITHVCKSDHKWTGKLR